MTKVFLNNELTNEQYHEDTEFVSGSELASLYFTCPAEYRYAEREEKQALTFGTNSHALMLEPSRFEAEFVREPSPDDYEGVLRTDIEMRAWLSERGIKGGSGKKADELIEMILATGEKPYLYKQILKDFQEANNDKTIVSAKDWDIMQKMRSVLFSVEQYRNWFDGAETEVSVFCEIDGYPVKCRFDVMTKSGRIVDYKSAASSKPDDFGRSAHDNGYWLKMALQHDVFTTAYGRDPESVTLLAQCKKSPFIPVAFDLTSAQLDVGRMQYKTALKIMFECRKTNIWPMYGSPVMDLPTPDYLLKRYGMEK
jgi:hypothetical protein